MMAYVTNTIRTGDYLRIIYCSEIGSFSQRIIRIQTVNEDYVHAFCYTKSMYRTFKIANILALEPYEQTRGGMHHESA